MIKELIVATHNPGKLREITALLHPISCLSQAELNISEADETGLTFIENALIKARHAAKLGGKPALADDSGLVVPVLQGQPGIYSARFAKINQKDKPESRFLENNEYLLSLLKEVPLAQRYAYFYCAIVLVQHATDPTPIFATGKWEGYIADEPQGKQGFGYDPVFFLPTFNCTAAQLVPEEKNKISHRALALSELKDKLMQRHHDPV